jgi:hypothetical protein
MPAPKTSLLLPLLSAALLGQDTAAGLLSKALQAPNDEQINGELVRSYAETKDRGLAPGLRGLLGKITDRYLRRNFAMFMWINGEKDDLYYNTVAEYAREAVMSDAPLAYFLDREGNAIRQDQPPVAFTGWCEAHSREPAVCLMGVLEQGVDVMDLGALKDRRAIPRCGRGLSQVMTGSCGNQLGASDCSMTASLYRSSARRLGGSHPSNGR